MVAKHPIAALLLASSLLTSPPRALAQLALQPAAPGAGLCRTAIAMAEQAGGVPDRLMQAIGVMESGRRDAAGVAAAWPWTINVEGAGEVFESKASAIAAVLAHQARGARSIDVGCMQVNLMHHPDAFASLEEAFDPPANARYAARFLKQLLASTGSWPRAVAAYHSLTPDIGADYVRKVLAIWARPEEVPAATAPAQPTGVAAAGPQPALPSGALPHSVPAAGVGPGFTGRGLDSYRALPARAGWASPFKRF